MAATTVPGRGALVMSNDAAAYCWRKRISASQASRAAATPLWIHAPDIAEHDVVASGDGSEMRGERGRGTRHADEGTPKQESHYRAARPSSGAFAAMSTAGTSVHFSAHFGVHGGEQRLCFAAPCRQRRWKCIRR